MAGPLNLAVTQDLIWRDDPSAWHQQLARIVDHRFSTFDELYRFAHDAKKAGVSALMLIEIQKTKQCPGPWYNGLQLCDHINGSYPASDGNLTAWRKLLAEIKPMRFMWWVNPAYWSVQGPVWAQAVEDQRSDVGRWFSWGSESCEGVRLCMGRNVVVPGVGCAQGSWGSMGMASGVKSALASFGAREYADYMVDAMANSWTRQLGIDGYCEDVSANYGCMMQTRGRGSRPFFNEIVDRVRALQPQIVMSGEGYHSWREVLEANANVGGQGYLGYHVAMQRAVFGGDASTLEHVASTSGADAASVLCYLDPLLDGKQPGGCPTMYFRDKSATIHNVSQHQLWVALEAGSGIVPQHDYDPGSTCMGWEGCEYWMRMEPPGAWWNVTNDPFVEGTESPLWAFARHRALNRLALRTKLPIQHSTGRGALVYLKHDAMGPDGDACLMVFNPGRAQNLTIDLSQLPAHLLDGSTVPYDLFRGSQALGPALSAQWSVAMGAVEARAYGGFRLGVFAPRKHKWAHCRPDADAALQRRAAAHTLEGCFLECWKTPGCATVHVEHVQIVWMEAPPPYRAGVLRDGATYNLSAVPLVPTLPVLTEGNAAAFPQWHAYVKRIHGDGVRFPIDLNAFTWFYWDSPLRLTRIYLCDWIDDLPKAPYGTPWTGGLAAWPWGPEHLVRRAGFFVHRLPYMGLLDPAAASRAPQEWHPISRATIEVMRIGPIPMRSFEEVGNAWFFHAIGSGIFVRTAGFARVRARYPSQMSVPRVEIVADFGGLRPPFTTREEEYWPDSLHFELYDGTPHAMRLREIRSKEIRQEISKAKSEQTVSFFSSTPATENSVSDNEVLE